MHIFAYGPLMNPAALRTTLPHTDLNTCAPARLHGYVRSFDVGVRREQPPRMLMCNIRRHEDYNVNGICIPVDEADLHVLSNHEHRYDLVDVTTEISLYPPTSRAFPGPVMALVGKPEFLSTQGVVARAHLEELTAGARHWDEVAPEFYHLTMGCTLFPPGESIVNLERLDGEQRP